MPAFAVKRDAIPGFVNEAWTRIEKPGIYRGQCAELCGKDHGFMPIVVEVKSKADYDTWLGDGMTVVIDHSAHGLSPANEWAGRFREYAMKEVICFPPVSEPARL